jgi:hypothetical protein
LQTNCIGAKRVRFNYARAGRDVFVVNDADPVRLTNTKLFQTMIDRHAPFEQQRAHRAIAANNSLLKLLK